MATPVMDVFDPRVSAAGRSTGVSAQGSLTHPPDYEQLYQAMQMQSYDDNGGSERVRKKYACQGLKLVASALAEDTSALSPKEVNFSRDLYVNGVEYIIRGLPQNLPASEKQKIHILLRKLQPVPHDHTPEPYPLIIFLFRQLGLLMKHISPHIQSLALRLVEIEQRYNVVRGLLETGMGMAERGVNLAVRLGVNDALVNFGTALGRGMGESYRVYTDDRK